MTRLFKSLAVLVMLGCLFSCSNNEKDEMVERKRRTEEREARDEADRKKVLEQQGNPKPDEQYTTEPEVPEAPPEPQYEEVTTYYFTSTTERGVVECYEQGAQTPCGIEFTTCKGEMSYACQTGVKAWSKTEKRLVTE